MTVTEPEKPGRERCALGLTPTGVFDAVRPYVERFVRRFVARNPHLESDQDDLLQVGLMELWKIAPGFNPDLGHSPHTFALRRVRGAVIDHLRQSREMSGLTTRDVIARRGTVGKHAPGCFSLNVEMEPSDEFGEWNHPGEDPATSVIDPELTDDPAAELVACLRSANICLSEQQRSILVEHLTTDKPQAVIAAERGLSPSYISKVIRLAIGQARKALVSRGARTFE